MKRREFLTKAGVGTVLAGSSLALSANAKAGPSDNKNVKYKWKMVTTWPKNFPGLGTGANTVARMINEMSGGRMEVKVYGAKQLVGPFEVFNAVSSGDVQMGHGAAYYWKNKSTAAQFFAAVPFGLNAQEMNGWLYYGGGMKLWKEIYDDFGLIPAAAGNSGVQMGGWFNKEIKTVDDLKGLKMRIPGLGGEVLKRAGGTPGSLPGGEIYTSLQSGAIDATEWVGPYNDLAFGFYKVAKFYYYPGWHEPGTTLEAIINKKAFLALPKDLQRIVECACAYANQDMLAEYTARNNAALHTLVNKHKVNLKQFPDAVLSKIKTLSDDVVKEVANTDAIGKKVYASFSKFRDQARAWHDVSEKAYYNVR